MTAVAATAGSALRRAVGPTFSSLRVRNYRVWAAGAIVSNTGTWMQRIAQDWLVFNQLTNQNSIILGVTTALQFGPQLVLGPLTGLAADRLPGRRLLTITQATSGVWALLLGLLVLLGDPHLWEVLVLATLLGVTSAFDAPVRQTFVTALVPPEQLSNAVGLNSASFNGARLIGPAVAGVLIGAVGTGWVFMLNAASFAATVLALGLMRADELHEAPRRKRGAGGFREGIAYVRGRPDILLILLVIGLVGAFGMNFQMTTVLMARVQFGRGASSYGLLSSIMAVGSLGGALLAARRERPRLRLVVGAAAAFGVFAIIASLMPDYWAFAVALVPVGLSSLTLMTAANATVQRTTEPALRGRVMALYMAIFAGTTPIGAPIVGWVGGSMGPRWSIAVGGIAALVAVAAAVWVAGRHEKVRVHFHARTSPHWELTLTPLAGVEAPVDPEPVSASKVA